MWERWQSQKMAMIQMNIRMENKKILNYKAFFADQVKESVNEQQKINRSSMRQLFRSGDISLAYVETIQRETGMVILKFPRRMAPRLKVQKAITIISKGAFQSMGNHPLEWGCTWANFCDTYKGIVTVMTMLLALVLVVSYMIFLTKQRVPDGHLLLLCIIPFPLWIITRISAGIWRCFLLTTS